MNIWDWSYAFYRYAKMFSLVITSEDVTAVDQSKTTENKKNDGKLLWILVFVLTQQPRKLTTCITIHPF